ncbi:GNAT family N-acetyltransferase [Sphingomonas crusticola]|uniref:GNAT family N-acetyltransferase n=1 Tax=Sphingomonas crusticola TaxID=1697973 RepID=UPI000E26A161|nr:GNAT family N-acetyltransferase [Sphingomonas crusticola]
MSALHVRDAAEADLPALIVLLADDENGRLREDPSQPLDSGYRAAFAAIEANPDQRLLVAISGREIVGTLQLSFLPGLSYRGAWRGQIEAVRIASQFRSKGLGEQMIAWAVERCRERGCNMVQLTTKSTRLRAHAFYERLGFTPSHIGMKLHLV